MKQYLHILQGAFPAISIADINIPIKETEIDSLDLVVIRVAIEKHFGFEISDTIWYSFQTLSEALKYFHQSKSIKQTNKSRSKNISISRSREIRMPQMANSSLSENWLLKEFGDIHWALLSLGLGRKSSELKDENDNRLYATFVRIKYLISPLSFFKENDTIEFNAQIQRFGNNTYISKVQGVCRTGEIEASLMTSFSIRENEDNLQITKSNPIEKINQIEQIVITPDFLNEYRFLKKGLLKEITLKHGSLKITDKVIWNCIYEINPFYEINGVGLLYFASYPIIADKCLLDYTNTMSAKVDFHNSYHTVYRDIFYFANCNPNDKVIFNLNSIEELEEQLTIVSSLWRQSDNVILAKIINVKQKCNE